MENTLINILTRTSRRPKFFEVNLKSVLAQDYPLIRHLVSYDDPETEQYLKGFLKKYPGSFEMYPVKRIEPEGGSHFPFNLYLNRLQAEVKSGWIMFLDDDDIFIENTAVSQLVKHLPNINQMLFWQVKFPTRIVPKHCRGPPRLGEISCIGFMFHSSLIKVASWGDQKGGDYRVIKLLYDHLDGRARWLQLVLTAVNYDINRPFGSGQRNDLGEVRSKKSRLNVKTRVVRSGTKKNHGLEIEDDSAESESDCEKITENISTLKEMDNSDSKNNLEQMARRYLEVTTSVAEPVNKALMVKKQLSASEIAAGKVEMETKIDKCGETGTDEHYEDDESHDDNREHDDKCELNFTDAGISDEEISGSVDNMSNSDGENDEVESNEIDDVETSDVEQNGEIDDVETSDNTDKIELNEIAEIVENGETVVHEDMYDNLSPEEIVNCANQLVKIKKVRFNLEPEIINGESDDQYETDKIELKDTAEVVEDTDKIDSKLTAMLTQNQGKFVILSESDLETLSLQISQRVIAELKQSNLLLKPDTASVETKTRIGLISAKQQLANLEAPVIESKLNAESRDRVGNSEHKTSSSSAPVSKLSELLKNYQRSAADKAPKNNETVKKPDSVSKIAVSMKTDLTPTTVSSKTESESLNLKALFAQIYIVDLNDQGNQMKQQLDSLGIRSKVIRTKTNRRNATVFDFLPEIVRESSKRALASIMVIMDSAKLHKQLLLEIAHQYERLAATDWKLIYLGGSHNLVRNDQFDWQYYLGQDGYGSDLRSHNITNEPLAQRHWKYYGQKEGRFGARTIDHQHMIKNISAVAVHQSAYEEIGRHHKTSQLMISLTKSLKQKSFAVSPLWFLTDPGRINKARNKHNLHLYQIELLANSSPPKSLTT